MSTTDMYRVSEELAVALNLDTNEQTRNQIVTAVIEYVTEHNLIDNENKMVYHTDGLLEWLMDGKKVTSAFSAFRDLKDHIFSIDSTEEEEEEDSDEGEEEDEDEKEEEEEEEEEEEDEEEVLEENELTLENAEGKTLTFKFVRGYRGARMSIHGFEMDHNEFIDAYVKLTEDNPWDESTLNILFLSLSIVLLTMFSLWLSLYNQSCMRLINY